MQFKRRTKSRNNNFFIFLFSLYDPYFQIIRSSQFESPRKVSSIMGKKSNQIQIFIILVSAPFRRYIVGGAHHGDLYQGTHIVKLQRN